MCGIFGFFNFPEISSNKTLDEMAYSLRHRGPDDTGYYLDEINSTAVGNTRLSIFDIEHGKQPFYSEDKNIVVVQNGEIFNFIELRKELEKSGVAFQTDCDTEVILRLYESEGIDFVPKLNGMFAIAIWDKRNKEMYLIRDRVGEKPFYIYEKNDQFVFASEIKAILKAGVKAELNYKALNQFLTFNFIPPPETIFAGIKHIEPATIMRVTKNNVESWKWWNLADQKIEDKTESEWIDEFNSILRDAVKIRMRSDVDFGAFLSGGVDSSSVVGLMSKLSDDQVKTYCIGFADPKFDESPYAEEAAVRFNTSHTTQIVEPNMVSGWHESIYYCDQPHGDISFLPTRKVAELASKDVTVVLTGDGGDELFAGYDKYKQFFANEETDHALTAEKQTAYYKNISLFQNEDRENLYSEITKQHIGNVDESEAISELCKASSHLGGLNQALYIDMMHLLPGNNLVKPDRMGMSLSIETRAPFLDYRMMELAFRIPGRLKLHDGVTKKIYKQSVENLIGENLTYRKKQMFTVPVGNWFKTDLKEFCEEHLFSERATSRGLFRKDVLVEMWEGHLSGEKNYTREIRALIALELWFRKFIDPQNGECIDA